MSPVLALLHCGTMTSSHQGQATIPHLKKSSVLGLRQDASSGFLYSAWGDAIMECSALVIGAGKTPRRILRARRGSSRNC
jgi:hypothetical protein